MQFKIKITHSYSSDGLPCVCHAPYHYLTPTAVAGQTHLTREYVRERFRHRLWLPDLRPKSASCLRHALSGGARQWHLCCVLALSTRFRRSLPPPPHTHTCHAGQSSAGNCLKSFTLHQFALLLPLLPTLNCKCVCVCQGGGRKGGSCAHTAEQQRCDREKRNASTLCTLPPPRT